MSISRQRTDAKPFAIFDKAEFLNPGQSIKDSSALKPGHTIVTILADYGTRYQSKLFNPEFLATKELLASSWLSAPLPHRSVPFAETV